MSAPSRSEPGRPIPVRLGQLNRLPPADAAALLRLAGVVTA